jgi:hypothetical protein
LLAVQRPVQPFDICIEPPPPRPDRRPVMTALTLPLLPTPCNAPLGLMLPPPPTLPPEIVNVLLAVLPVHTVD